MSLFPNCGNRLIFNLKNADI